MEIFAPSGGEGGGSGFTRCSLHAGGKAADRASTAAPSGSARKRPAGSADRPGVLPRHGPARDARDVARNPGIGRRHAASDGTGGTPPTTYVGWHGRHRQAGRGRERKSTAAGIALPKPEALPYSGEYQALCSGLSGSPLRPRALRMRNPRNIVLICILLALIVLLSVIDWQAIGLMEETRQRQTATDAATQDQAAELLRQRATREPEAVELMGRESDPDFVDPDRVLPGLRPTRPRGR